MTKDYKKIMVLIRHPHGDIEMSLKQWVRHGPSRKYVAPIGAKCKETNNKLPMSTIPLKYRNNWFSRLLIYLGLLENPWQ